MVEWESEEVTYEPLTLISKDDPIQFMPRNMIFLTQQDGNTSKDMPRLPKDSSELSNNPGFAKLEHQFDINMVSKSQRITMMLQDLTRKKATHIGKMQWTLS